MENKTYKCYTEKTTQKQVTKSSKNKSFLDILYTACHETWTNTNIGMYTTFRDLKNGF